MSHIEDPTIKTKAPTSLLKAVGHIHLIASHTYARLIGERAGDGVPTTLLDYAREADDLGNQIGEGAVQLHHGLVETYCGLVDAQTVLDHCESVLGIALGNRAPIITDKQALPTATVLVEVNEKLSEIRAAINEIHGALGDAERNEDGSLIRHT